MSIFVRARGGTGAEKNTATGTEKMVHKEASGSDIYNRRSL
jgi:hypothetical protein